MNELTLESGITIQIAENDFDTQYDWTTAILMCQEIGEGWRLPTIYEIEQIFENAEIFDFANYGFWAYWTNDEINTEQAYGFSGVEGNIVQEFKDESFYVRAVKTII
jgi:hypothetical protein